MTEHSKIPLPSEEPESKDGNSLFERAVKTFDLGKFAPPPVPADLAPYVQKAGARYQARLAQQLAGASESPPEVENLPVAAPETVPEAVQASAPETAPAPVTPVEPVAAPPPAVELVAARADIPDSVRFRGPHHAIDRDHLRERGLIVPEGSVTGLLEEFRIVKRQLLLQATELRREGGGPAAQRVLVCSPHPNEGKTYCSVNLALSMASEKESDVLLVDADFAKPSVLSSLGIPGGPGLMDALTDPSIDVLDCVLGTDIPGLWVLPAGNATNSDSEFLSSSRTRTVLDRLTEGAPHRMVIFDSPPALAASPAAELAKYVGQAALVARADRTGQGALEDAISLLSGCPNIQLILNAVNFSPSGRRFGSYYGYGG